MALIGHSGRYRCRHASSVGRRPIPSSMVTAGSPVANHPDSATHVGHQREIDDELVAAWMDAANPVTDNWLNTYRGMYRPRQHHPQCIRTAHALPGATPITV